MGTPHQGRREGELIPLPFIIIPGSKFSSLGIFSPTVTVLSASSPSEVQDPLPCAGAQSPASIGSGWRWGLSQSLWRRILFFLITSAAHGGATEAAATPGDMGDIPGAEQDPACGAQSSAPHPSWDKDTPGHCLHTHKDIPSSQSGKSHQDRGSSQSLAKGWDKVKREVEEWSRICPAYGWEKL